MAKEKEHAEEKEHVGEEAAIKGKESEYRIRHMGTAADQERKAKDQRHEETDITKKLPPDTPTTGILPEEQDMDCHHCGHHRKEHHGGASEGCHYEGCPCRAWSPYFAKGPTNKVKVEA